LTSLSSIDDHGNERLVNFLQPTLLLSYVVIQPISEDVIRALLRKA